MPALYFSTVVLILHNQKYLKPSDYFSFNSHERKLHLPTDVLY